MRQGSVTDFALLALGVSFAVVMILALVAGCGAATPSPKVTSCGEQYTACVMSSHTMAEYRVCRAKADETCLPAYDGGAE